MATLSRLVASTALVSMAASSAFAQATITSSHRHVSASSLVQVYGPGDMQDVSETEDIMETQDLGVFGYDAAASATVYGVERHTSAASLISNVQPNGIGAVASTTVSGYDLIKDYHVRVGALVEMDIEFSLTAPMTYSLEVIYDSVAPGAAGFDAFVFDLASDSETILALNNTDAYDTGEFEYADTVSLSGTLAPGDYSLFASAQPVMYLFHDGQGFFRDSSFSFALSMEPVPAPSTLLTIAAPVAYFTRRRRR